MRGENGSRRVYLWRALFTMRRSLEFMVCTVESHEKPREGTVSKLKLCGCPFACALHSHSEAKKTSKGILLYRL